MAEFLSRWSARKAAMREGKPVAEPVPSTTPVQAELVEAAALQPPPVLTLDDVAMLTPASDFSTFVAKGVDTVVKNAAMKKLFSDPHYNIMDGLDIYIGDYSTHDVLPQSVIDEITKDGFLNMFRKEEISTEVEEMPAESITPTESLSHDDPNLQLQRDDATRRKDAVDCALQQPEVSAGLEVAQSLVPPPST